MYPGCLDALRRVPQAQRTSCPVCGSSWPASFMHQVSSPHGAGALSAWLHTPLLMPRIVTAHQARGG